MHFISYLVWIIYRVTESVAGHSGYDMPWSPFNWLPLSSTPSFHDYHHLKNMSNYGSQMMIFDYLFGTAGKYFENYEKEHPQFVVKKSK